MNRITEKFLEAQVANLNRLAGTPVESYTQTEAGYKPSAFNYHIDHAYGGVSLHQFGATGSGIRDVFGCGHVPKRELSDRIYSYMAGMRDTKEAA